MRKLKYIFLLILSASLLNSCLIDDTTNYDLNNKGLNLAGFDLGVQTCAAIADGSEYTFKLKVKVVGPTSMNLKNDITLTVAADPTSTAVLGVNYRIDDPTIVLTASNNYLGFVEITMLTAGIVTPYVGKMPVLVVNVSSATGDAAVINNGKPITVTLSYKCFSDLEGVYNTHCIITRAISGAVTTYPNWNEPITETGIGTYRTQIVAYAGYIPLGTGTDGYTFVDDCNVLSVPEQNLLELYSNIVIGTAKGSVDPVTGVLRTFYSVSTTAAAGYRLCDVTYTPVP